uniref:Uncharacterized protein n=1 Tax=Panagrolaimus sp. ES5 TaxID=591445 RepID=A0AC34FM08_9BILA
MQILGNRVYVHPISGDLQQCSQQLGFYNQTTCPGGTVCERFPILIPGFQLKCPLLMAQITPSPRRGPRCDNPDDAALIDFGNRLRDCYYQQCPYNYRCEFNTDIRRYICCGKERDVFPPPGLPPLPEPQPVVPRPFRPRMPPPYLHGEEVENPLSQTSALLETNDEGDNQVTENNICPLGNEHRTFLGGISFCEPDNLNLICPVSHPYCVHSKIWGATVCCSSSNTLPTTEE